MHQNHTQEEGRVKRGLANVVICFVQSLQLGILICWSLRGGGVKNPENADGKQSETFHPVKYYLKCPPQPLQKKDLMLMFSAFNGS